MLFIRPFTSLICCNTCCESVEERAERLRKNDEDMKKISELKNQVAAFSIEIAEKVVRGELAADDKQKALAGKLAEEINLN